MKKRVYIETSVVSYLTARPSRDLLIAAHQEATRAFWPKMTKDFDAFVSGLVYEEAARGDCDQARIRLDAIKPFHMLDATDDGRILAEKIIEGRGIPEEYPEDALHIAIAAVNSMDVLVTWNFTHLNNPFTRMMVRQIVGNAGYVCPEICSPEELLEVNQ